MIFLHGANSAGAELQAFVDAMKPYTPVRTPDMLGHRGRPIPDRITIGDVADDIVAWMDREGIDRDVLGGYSFGGTVALYLARHHPARVSGVVPLASKHVFDATTLQRWTHLLSHARVEGITLPGGIRRVDELTRLHAPSKWQDVLDLNARLVSGFATQVPLTEADLKAIRAPVLIVSSNLDQIVPWAETMALGRALPDAQVAMFYGPAHPLRAIPLPAIARNIHEWMVKRQLA